MKMIRVNSKLISNILDGVIFRVWKAHAKALMLRRAKTSQFMRGLLTTGYIVNILSHI